VSGAGLFRDAAIAYREREVSRIANMTPRSDPSGEWTSDDAAQYRLDVLRMLRKELRALHALPRDCSRADVLRACGFTEEQIADRERAS